MPFYFCSMKSLVMGLIVLATIGCSRSNVKRSKMKQARIIEMVLWKFKQGIDIDEAKRAVAELNDFVREQPGFVARKTALAEDGRFLDIVYWTDLKSARTASEKALENEDLIPIFNMMDEEEMIFQHFELFNNIE